MSTISRDSFSYLPSLETGKQADETAITDGGHFEVCPVCREEFADFGMFCLIAEQGLQLFLENQDDLTEYRMLEVQDGVSGYRDSPVISNGDEGNLTAGADLDIDSFQEAVDDDGH